MKDYNNGVEDLSTRDVAGCFILFVLLYALAFLLFSVPTV
jgi:hypothetical protein